MKILGIETTCDETAAAVVINGEHIASNIVASQLDIHRPYGGVVPELASREHLNRLPEVIKQALAPVDQIDQIAVAYGPGLIGALLVGVHTAKGLAMSMGKPLVGVNHVEAHLYAAMMGRSVPLPALGVVISGGHTALLLIENVGQYRLISSTVDDAIGEAFDKVAAMLGLPYPGGPEIEKQALSGDPMRYPFSAGRVKEKPLAFSFSGLKTSVLYTVKGQKSDKNSPTQIRREEIPHIAASFQAAAFSDLVNKVGKAADRYGCQAIVCGGGVANNQALRRQMQNTLLPTFWPPPGLSVDNAAMIAGLAYHKEPVSLDLQVAPRLQPFWK